MRRRVGFDIKMHPRPGCLILYRPSYTLIAIDAVVPHPSNPHLFRYQDRRLRNNRDSEFIPIPQPRRWYEYGTEFHRGFDSYACCACLEPFEAHVNGKCPFAATHFVARIRHAKETLAPPPPAWLSITEP